MNYNDYSHLDKLVEIEYNLFNEYQSLVNIEVAKYNDKKEHKAKSYTQIKRYIDTLLLEEQRLLSKYNDESLRSKVVNFFILQTINDDTPTFATLLSKGDQNSFIKARIIFRLNEIGIKNHQDEKMITLPNYHELFLYNFEQLLIDNTKEIDNEEELFELKSKYFLAFLFPDIERELLDNNFNKINDNKLFFPNNNFRELVLFDIKQKIDYFISNLVTIQVSGFDDKYNKQLSLLCIYSLVAISKTLTNKEKQKIKEELLKTINNQNIKDLINDIFDNGTKQKGTI